MTDFLIDGATGGRALGRFGLEPAFGRRTRPGARDNDPEKSAAPKPLRALPNLQNALHLPAPKPPKAKANPAAPEDASEVIPDPEDEKQQVSADRLINGYVNFLKSLQKGDEPLDAEGLAKLSDDLFHVVADPLGINEDDIQELRISSEYTLAQAYAAYASQDENGSQAGYYASVSASAHLSADIVTKSGERFHIELSLEAQRVEQAAVVQGEQSDPLVLDANGDGVISLSDIQNGFQFDINADGLLDQSSFVDGGDAFLALDRNGNGAIDDGSELFGDQHGAANGFEELRKYDEDGNDRIDANDPVFSRLVGLRRGEGGGLEQFSLATLAVQSLELSYEKVSEHNESGNQITERASYRAASASYALVDALLGYRTLSKDA